jgi:hypothetical protein
VDNEFEQLRSRSLAQISDMIADNETAAALHKANLTALKAELSRRFLESARQSLIQQGKDYGTANLELQDGFKVKVELRQKVKWDSVKLMAVARELPFERVEALFKIEFSMSETVYKGVSALSPELRAKIDDARTTSPDTPKLTLTKEA